MFYLSFAKEVKDVSLDLTLQTGKVGHGQTWSWPFFLIIFILLRNYTDLTL